VMDAEQVAGVVGVLDPRQPGVVVAPDISGTSITPTCLLRERGCIKRLTYEASSVKEQTLPGVGQEGARKAEGSSRAVQPAAGSIRSILSWRRNG
jgi:hypothetical protein